MKTNNDSILSILYPVIGLLILSALIFSVVQSCNVKLSDKDAQQKTEEKPIEQISNLESGYCVISDSNDLTQTQLKIKRENIDIESYKPAIKITLNDKTAMLINYSMYCMD